ncbi:MAG: NAD-glutamate dehydrogenase [Deltaproteobacteria bacterium]
MTDADAIVEDLLQRLRATATQVVPWFLAQMPDPYIQDTPVEVRRSHLAAIVASRLSGVATRMALENEDGRIWTFIEEKNYPGLLAELLRQLPQDRTLSSAKVHTAADGKLVLDVFRFDGSDAPFDPSDTEQAAKLAATQAFAAERGAEGTDLERFFATCTATFVRSASPLRIHACYGLWNAVRGTEDTAVRITEQAESGVRRISVATRHEAPRELLSRVVTHLGDHHFDIRRAYLDAFGDVSVLGFVVDDADGRLTASAEAVRADLVRLKWIDEVSLLFSRRHGVSLVEAEATISLVHLAHAALTHIDRFAYARERMYETVDRHVGVVKAIVDVFLSDGAEATGELQLADLGRIVDDYDRRVVQALADATRATRAHNAKLVDRYAFAIRFDPKYLTDDSKPDEPFGAFFVHGRHFDGFHVRFRDVARGGVRVVRPRGPEEHVFNLERLYDEAYGLARAQQLKNKDIPEGGSKAVVLTEPGTSVAPSLQAFADGLLDVILETGERLYLGPDENVTDDLIEWIVARAASRGYATPNAFMSSKPGAGINHKVYGVTSEGVTVFLEEALRAVGIDPREDDFTVKLTGGPDGDVAGNEIKILVREYGARARIVGIADGSGSARDPAGLDHEELLRLVAASLPIAAFDRSKLSAEGVVASLEDPDGLRLRNSMCFEVVADAFIPAGGRPQTIHEKNWRDYLDAAGNATSRVIVEGANLFITPEARRLLSTSTNVLIVKDSSANKCGVICSSYEIAASLLLEPDAFMAVKERFVEEVLTKLRALARREAVLLFAEHARDPSLVLPELSVSLSRTILAATDAIEAALVATETDLDDLVREHLPPVLLEVAGDRIDSGLPRPYRISIIAASLATRIVYREGLAYLENLDGPALAELAMRYLVHEREVRRLIASVEASGMADREAIAALLDHGGTRSAVALSRRR